MKKVVLIIIIVLAVFAVIGVSIYNAKTVVKVGGAPKTSIAVTTEKATEETIVTKVVADGVVDINDSNIIYASNTGTISTVNFKIGDYVNKGDILLTYKNDTYENLNNQLESAKLSLKSAQLAKKSVSLPVSQSELLQSDTLIRNAENSIESAEKSKEAIFLQIDSLNTEIQKAKDKYETNKILFESGAISKSDIDLLKDAVTQLEDSMPALNLQLEQADSQIQSAKSSKTDAESQRSIILNKNNEASVKSQEQMQQVSIEQAELQIKQIEKSIADFKQNEIATVSGTLLTSIVDNGVTVSQGMNIMSIGEIDTDNLIIKVDVSEYDISSIKEGQKAEITGTALGDEVLTGIVSKIYPTANAKQIGATVKTMIGVEIKPDKNENKAVLRPGYSVKASVISKTIENAIVIPLMTTLTDDDGNDYVFIVKDDFSVEKRIVKLGEFSGLNIQADNIAVGETVISNAPSNIVDGSFVNPISINNTTESIKK